MRRAVWLGLLCFACSDSSGGGVGTDGATGGQPDGGAALDAGAGPDGPVSVDTVASGGIPVGTVLTLQGTVTGLSFQMRRGARGSGIVTRERIILLALAAGPATENDTAGAWGLGALLGADKLESREWRLPQQGDLVEVTGTVGDIDVVGSSRPLLEAVTAYRVITAAGPAMADVGEACAHDMDCQDDLWCDRNQRICIVATAAGWSSDVRNINGTCQTDADCPIGQICDPAYTVKGKGEFSAFYSASRDVGRFLCQVVDRNTAPPEQVCPRFASVDDVLGGRFAEGKEICARVTILFPVFNPGDRDTHLQAQIPFPKLYPESEPTLEVFGAAFENVPPYKDPEHPLGPLPDPDADTTVELLGTVKWDGGHGWWEMHPYKWVRVLP